MRLQAGKTPVCNAAGEEPNDIARFQPLGQPSRPPTCPADADMSMDVPVSDDRHIETVGNGPLIKMKRPARN